MTDEERFRVFLASMEPDLPEQLRELEQACKRDNVPLIRPQMQSLLRVLTAQIRPRRILEIGTGAGFSALFMYSCAGDSPEIVTIESDPSRAQKARENFDRSGCPDRFRLLEGDASRVLPALDGSFDLIFMDAAKGQYIHWLPDMRRLMHTGSVLVSDNVLQEGRLLESRYMVERRDRTIYRRMREYLHALTHDPGLATTILPIADGAALSVRLEEKT